MLEEQCIIFFYLRVGPNFCPVVCFKVTAEWMFRVLQGDEPYTENYLHDHTVQILINASQLLNKSSDILNSSPGW